MILAATGLRAELPVEFSGVMAGATETKVSLRNQTTGQSGWITVGKKFGDYLVLAYEPDSATVVLAKDGQKFRVPFKTGKIKDAGATAPGDPPPEIKEAVLNNLRQLSAAMDQFFLETGKKQATLEDLVGETKYVRKLVAVDGEDYRSLKFVSGTASLAVTTVGGYVVSYSP